jgi:eukaryotic-like serine/threonine-protein kinase
MDTTLARSPVGRLLDGRYRVESLIATGGMATVYLGTDTRLDRTVALKIMHAELAGDEDFVRRFVGEARSVARLSHPNVVGVYDQGADGRTLYLAMEYVPGYNLRDLLKERGRLHPAQALDIMDGLLAGLGAAHAAGMVHRDVKPENVLLADGGVVKVADFGLARLLAGHSHTKTGMLIGTAAYLAPEQVSQGTADARTDVYAAGVMLFEMLTGVQPHTADTPLAVAYKHVNEVVPAPSALVPGIPPALDDLVTRATSRDPGLRPADGSQFLQLAAGVRRSLPAPGGPASSGGYPGPPPAQDYAPGGWPAAPEPGLVPGLPGSGYEPGYEPGPGYRPGPGPAGAATAFTQMQDDAFARGANHTLVVSSPDAGPGYGPPRRQNPAGYEGPRESGLARWLFSRRLGYVLAGLLAVLLVGLGIWWQSAGRYATVPQVSGLSLATARQDLQNAGLSAKTGPGRFSSRVAKGSVIGTAPAIGSRVGKGGSVQLIVSKGPRLITVPQVTGQTLAGAQAALRHAGLTPGQVTSQTSTTIQSGIVISTTPPASTTWPQSKPVALVVSSGQPVPNFVGQQKSVAEQWAQANGVSLNEVTANSDQPAGTVTAQSVPPNGSFSPHQVITITISNGPQLVNVPNVQGQPVSQAEQQLSQAGFQVKVVQLGPLDTVFHQNPQGQAPQGSTITLYVGL